jgi:hypothetical protein
MCISAKASLLSFAIMAGISLALFIRNEQYDRILAALLIIVSLIQLTEYFFHIGSIYSDNAGRSIFIILWLQVAVLGLALYWHFRTELTLFWASIFVIIFLLAVLYSFSVDFFVNREDGHLVWTKGTKYGVILGSYSSWLYLIGLIIPLFIILYYNNWKNIGMWIILVAIALSIFFVKWFYPNIIFPSMWCYSAIFVAFVFWLVAAFNEHVQVA